MRIEIRGLHKSYWMNDAEIPVLRALDVVIEPGQYVSLTGPSGVGKSTFLHVLGTLDTPTQGQVIFDDVDLWQQPPAAIARFRNKFIGFVFQFHHLLPEFTALENVIMPARVQRAPLGPAVRRAKELLAEVGLAHRIEHRPGELSGGEQQRVALARALMNEPRVLLADEPTGNLDETTGAGIHEIVERLNRERGITAIVVTHNPRLAERMPRRLHLDRTGLHDVGARRPEHPPVPT
ncbi:MAG: ABC transporter ATP-binding protein [Deltaproteobacteria bacterium RBG_16_71_12]|nr:MAG: ABC transporter ATP-binding protein [Deltaproteobacteria bacterium RBG_16_71_12]